MARPERQLSAREVQALQLAADGLMSKPAAKQMGITSSYVKYLWWNTAQKLGADNIRHAVAMGIRRGLIH